MCAEKLTTVVGADADSDADAAAAADADGSNLRKLRSNPTASLSRASATSPIGSVGSSANEKAALLPSLLPLLPPPPPPAMIVTMGIVMESWPSECNDVIRRAHVSRRRGQQATAPERALMGCFATSF